MLLRSGEERGPTLYISPPFQGRTATEEPFSSTLFLTQHRDQQAQQMASRRPRTEGSARGRPSLRGPVSTNRDFWTQGSGHPATATSPSKTETELSRPANAAGTRKVHSSHTMCPIWRENYPKKALGPVRMIPGYLGRKRGWGCVTELYTPRPRDNWMALESALYRTSTLGFLHKFCRLMRGNVVLSPLQQTLQGYEAVQVKSRVLRLTEKTSHTSVSKTVITWTMHINSLCKKQEMMCRVHDNPLSSPSTPDGSGKRETSPKTITPQKHSETNS